MAAYPDRVSLANIPTPIREAPRLSEIFGGPEIDIKCDDLTGSGLTGNKVRKLEFLLAEAREQQADVLITCGGLQSNHARATAVAAARAGLKCHLVLRRANASGLGGNLFLDRLVNAEIKFIKPDAYARVDEIMADVAEHYRERGLRAYVIPEGGSNALGAFGYIRAVEEICEQAGPDRYDVVIAATGSGGTHAGLLLGKKLHGLQAEIWGVNVCDDASYFVKRISGIAADWKKRFDSSLRLAKSEIRIVDGFVGKGYGLSRREEIDLIKQVAEQEGLLLDPVYTGKAMLGLKTLVEQGKLKRGQRVLFVHTGGIFGLFAKQNLFF